MNKYKTTIITTLYIFVLNIVFSYLIYNYLHISYIVFYLLESISISMIITIICNLFKEKIRKPIFIIFYLLISFLFLAQYVHYHFYDCFFSIFSLLHGGQVLGFIPAIIKVITSNITGFIILLIISIIATLLLIKCNNQKNSIKTLSILLVLNIIFTVTLTYIPYTTDIYSRKNLLKNENVETKNVQKFGLITAMSIDVKRYFLEANYNLIVDNNKETYTKEKYNIKDISFNIKTDDKQIKKLNNYLKNSKPTNKNEYTGIFKNKNLIFITAESFSFSIIDKNITPTLYKLQHEGLNFSNFYTPIYYASTSDGEYTNLTGLIPKEGTWSYMKTKDNNYPYSYANIFKENNYTVRGYHNGIYDFYKRNEVMPNFGYDFKGCGNGLEKEIDCNIWPQSDDEMITSTYNDYKNDKHFHTYYMSISGHLNHSFKDNAIAIKYKNKVKDLKYSDSVKAYISANIDLDKALEHLLDNLKKDNKLDDTVIVLVPDHYPYGLSKNEYSELKKLDTAYDKHKSGLIIYNPSIESKTIDKYSSNIDILPTILNMFGIEYDSRLIIGKDIMSDSEGIVMFNDHSFLTKEGFYNEKTNKATSFNSKFTNTYIKEKRKEVLNKINASSIILGKDYYKYIK